MERSVDEAAQRFAADAVKPAFRLVNFPASCQSEGMPAAQGNLQEAASLRSDINEQTPDEDTVGYKVTQLRLERNYVEAIRLLRARQSQFRVTSEQDKADDQLMLALMQRLSGDMAGAKVTAESACDILEQLYTKTPDHFVVLISLSKAYAVMGRRIWP